MEPDQFISESRIADMEYAARVAAVQANANLAAAQEAYDELSNGDTNAIAVAQASLALAVAPRDAAQIQLDMLLMDPTEAEIAAAESSVASAEAALDQLERGASDYHITQAEVAVEQARISLQQAENALNDATLTAPFDGVVTAVHVNVGEMANGILVEMVDSSSLEVILAVDEVDIGNIYVGQPAVITLQSWPNVEIDGQVMAVAPTTGPAPWSPTTCSWDWARQICRFWSV
jgi:multidrug resistance efflux pump